MHVGTFKIKSGKVFVSDPCYDLTTWCAGTLENVKNGNWYAKVKMSDDGSRVAALIASHQSYIVHGYYSSKGWEKQKFEVGVDSGQAGIYDYPEFRGGDDEEWYEKCCDLTNAELSAGIIEKSGVVSSTGYGDGGYTCYTITKDGKVTAIMIDYGLEEDEEEDEY